MTRAHTGCPSHSLFFFAESLADRVPSCHGPRSSRPRTEPETERDSLSRSANSTSAAGNDIEAIRHVHQDSLGPHSSFFSQRKDSKLVRNVPFGGLGFFTRARPAQGEPGALVQSPLHKGPAAEPSKNEGDARIPAHPEEHFFAGPFLSLPPSKPRPLRSRSPETCFHSFGRCFSRGVFAPHLSPARLPCASAEGVQLLQTPGRGPLSQRSPSHPSPRHEGSLFLSTPRFFAVGLSQASQRKRAGWSLVHDGQWNSLVGPSAA